MAAGVAAVVATAVEVVVGIDSRDHAESGRTQSISSTHEAFTMSGKQDAIPLDQRQTIFRAVVEAQDGGMTVAVSRSETARKFAITEEQVKEIEREGLAEGWPPL